MKVNQSQIKSGMLKTIGFLYAAILISLKTGRNNLIQNQNFYFISLECKYLGNSVTRIRKKSENFSINSHTLVCEGRKAKSTKNENFFQSSI